MTSSIFFVAMTCVAGFSFAAAPSTTPSSQPTTQSATTRRAQRIRPDAPDAVQRLASYSFHFHQQIVKQKQDEWNATKTELEARVNGKIDAKKDTARTMHMASKTGWFGTWTFKSGTERRMAIEEQQANVATAKIAWEAATADTSIVFPSTDTASQMIAPGWIGRVRYFKVEEIIDSHTVRARIPGNGPSASAMVYGAEGPTVIITGVDTSGEKIGKGLSEELPIWVKGAEKDAKTGHTVFKAEMFDLSKYLAD